jgi:hypothetical protein
MISGGLWASVPSWLLASAQCTAPLGPGIKVYVTAYFLVPYGTTRFKSQSTDFRWVSPSARWLEYTARSASFCAWGEPRFGPDRCGDCVDVAAGPGGLGVWTRQRREVFQRQRQRLGHRCEHMQRRLVHAARPG